MSVGIVLGNFDGCHLGHLALFNALKKESDLRGLSPLAISFEPHTRHIIQEKGYPELLTSQEEKRNFIESLGIPLFLQEFNKDLFAMPFRSFVEEFTIKKFGAKLWVLGLDQRFGRGGKGSAESLRAFFPNLEVCEISPVLYEDAGVNAAGGSGTSDNGAPISASRIRECLKNGNLKAANAMLGRKYSVCGTVVHGLGQGRLLGFPTANLELPKYKLLPKNGVYSGNAFLLDNAFLFEKPPGTSNIEQPSYPSFNNFLEAKNLGKRMFKCVINIGTRPSLGNRPVGFEAHLLNFNGDLYGKELKVELTEFMRDEIKFNSVDKLKEHIKRDVENVVSAI